MHFKNLQIVLALSPLPFLGQCAYSLVDDYALDNFFDKFDFITCDGSTPGCNSTGGFANFVDRGEAEATGLISQANGSVIIKPDSWTEMNVSTSLGRKSVRLESKRVYNHGLFVVDVKRMPGGMCGTWPLISLLSDGAWPATGEIDIIQGSDMSRKNNMWLHTPPGCNINGRGCSQTPGCSIQEAQNNSFGDLFNFDSGGVFAAERTPASTKIWFFKRSSAQLENALSDAPDPAVWGKPSAVYEPSATCDLEQHFSGAKIVIDLGFCRVGRSGYYFLSCQSMLDMKCSNFVAAYPRFFNQIRWEIQSLKVFSRPGLSIDPPAAADDGDDAAPHPTSCAGKGFKLLVSQSPDLALDGAYLAIGALNTEYNVSYIGFTDDAGAASAFCINDEGVLASLGNAMQAVYDAGSATVSTVPMTPGMSPEMKAMGVKGYRCTVSPATGEFTCPGNKAYTNVMDFWYAYDLDSGRSLAVSPKEVSSVDGPIKRIQAIAI